MKEIHSATFRTNETLARSAARKMFPNEKWLKKAEIIFFETTHKFSRQKIFDKMRGELLDMISRKTEVKTKTVWVKIQGSEIYELPISRLL